MRLRSRVFDRFSVRSRGRSHVARATSADVLTRIGICGVFAIGAYRAVTSLQQFAILLTRDVPDFAVFLHTARCLLSSACDPYFSAPALNLNPPIFHALLMPIASLDLSTAAIVWTIAGATVGAWTFRRIARALGMSAWAVAAVAGLWLASICAAQTFRQGQLSLLLFGPITLLWLAARNDRWIVAGVWAGLLIAVKPFLGLVVIWFAIRGQWRAVVVACTIASALALAGVGLFGWQATYGWLTSMSSVGETAIPENGSLAAWISRALSSTSQYQPLVLAPTAVLPVLVAAVTIVITIVLTQARLDVDRSLLLVLLSALLMSPIGWAHYGLWCLGPLVAVFRRGRSWWLIAGVLALLLPRIDPQSSPMTGWLAVTIGSAVAFGYVALFVGAATMRSVPEPVTA